MEIIDGLNNLTSADTATVLAIGNFDGLHLGHRHIIAQVVATARNRGLRSAIMTFRCHPLSVVNPAAAPETLLPLPQRLDELARLGIDTTIVVECSRELLDMDPQQFVDEYIVRRLRADTIIEGPNFRFGHDRRGDIAFLKDYGQRAGFSAICVDPSRVEFPGEGPTMISSSLVRQLIRRGEMPSAELCLGRPYEYFGRVVRGAGRGRKLNFPTANVEGSLTYPQMIPPNGVYAANTRFNDQSRPCAVHIGPVATFGQSHTTIEAHILDFAGEIYEQPISLQFIRRIRETRSFDSVDALTQQIRSDVADTRNILRQHAVPPHTQEHTRRHDAHR